MGGSNWARVSAVNILTPWGPMSVPMKMNHTPVPAKGWSHPGRLRGPNPSRAPANTRTAREANSRIVPGFITRRE